MMTKEEYKRELIRMWDSIRTEYIGRDTCKGVLCKQCRFRDLKNCASIANAFEAIEIVERWSKEHPQKKYKVSQIVYDALSLLAEFGYSMKTADGMTVEEYLENCDIINEIKIDERGTNEQTKD